MPTSYELLYISSLAPHMRVNDISTIVAQARERNAKRHITGLLVFDGHRFCQQLEGDKTEVLHLFRRIREDPRHLDVEVLHQGLIGQRRFKRFAMGYAAAGEDDLLARLERAIGPDTVQTLLSQLPLLDLDG